MLLQFVKYNLVGVVNTLVGFSIILLLMYMGLSATVSNILGYAIGTVISYILNSKYTFVSSTNNQAILVKFVMALTLAYILNFMTLQWLLALINPYLAQLGAAVVYSISSFMLVKYFVFKEGK